MDSDSDPWAFSITCQTSITGAKGAAMLVSNNKKQLSHQMPETRVTNTIGKCVVYRKKGIAFNDYKQMIHQSTTPHWLVLEIIQQDLLLAQRPIHLPLHCLCFTPFPELSFSTT